MGSNGKYLDWFQLPFRLLCQCEDLGKLFFQISRVILDLLGLHLFLGLRLAQLDDPLPVFPDPVFNLVLAPGQFLNVLPNLNKMFAISVARKYEQKIARF